MANLQSTNIFGTLKVHARTSSNDKDNGAMVILGGVGIGGNLNVGGDIKATDKEITISKINGLSITQATEKTLDLSNASLTIGDSKGTGKITIKSDDIDDKTLTLEASHTIKSLTKDYVLIVGKDDNVIESEAQLDISRGGTGKAKVDARQVLIGSSTDNSAPSWRKIISDDISDATRDNTSEMVVKRDEQGSFAANEITATLDGHIKTPVGLWGQSFDASTSITGALTDVGDIVPEDNNSADLGSNDKKFKDAYLQGDVSIGGSLTVTGDMIVKNTETVRVSDMNIELGVTENPSDSLADGGGITLVTKKTTVGETITYTGKTITWDNENKNWKSSENWDLESNKVYKIGNDTVLTSDSLGDNIKSSSLESVGAVTATSVNKVFITEPTDNATLTISDGKTLTVENTIKLKSSSGDGKTLNIGVGGDLLSGAFTDLSEWEGTENIITIGDVTTGSLEPSEADKDLGSNQSRYRDVYLSDSMKLGNFIFESVENTLNLYRVTD